MNEVLCFRSMMLALMRKAGYPRAKNAQGEAIPMDQFKVIFDKAKEKTNQGDERWAIILGELMRKSLVFATVTWTVAT